MIVKVFVFGWSTTDTASDASIHGKDLANTANLIGADIVRIHPNTFLLQPDSPPSAHFPS
ncbi:glycoside hydrolase family 95 protein [Moniliophthora roreri]|nr:glycoside hydrolase family 95 protein [Moniliophthora roreri]